MSAPREKSGIGFQAVNERAYRLDETIIRYLTIVLDKKALEHGLKLNGKKESENVTNSEKTETSKSENNESKE